MTGPTDDELYALNVTAAARSFVTEVDLACSAIRTAGRQLDDLTGCLFAVEWADGTVGEDIRHHLAAAARSLRAALALHRQAARSSDVALSGEHLAGPKGGDPRLSGDTRTGGDTAGGETP